MESAKSYSIALLKLIFSCLLGIFSINIMAASDQDKMLSTYDWAGTAIGVYVGGGWGDAHGNTDTGSLTDTSYYASTADINAVNQSGTSTLNPGAFTGGIQFSDNFFTRGHFVLGLIMDYGALNLSATHNASNITYPDNSGNYSLQTSATTSWVYTARARLGYALSSLSKPLLLYMTGGLALTNLAVSNELTDTTTLLGMGGSDNKTTQPGWTLGTGLEFPITKNLTVNGEYLFIDFGTVTVNSTIYNSAGGFGIDANSLVSQFNTSADLDANLFKVGLNYRFK